MNINRNNYEAFFLDFHEGNLSEEGKGEVLAFVRLNPDLKEEFESFEMIFVESQSMKFPGKENLKKTSNISVHNYKTWMVAYVEGDLNGNETAEIEKFLSENPAYGRELEILRSTKILPDYSISFKGKSSLKKSGVIIPMWLRVAAAACIAFGVLAYFFIQNKPESKFVQENNSGNKTTTPVQEPVKDVAELKSEDPVRKEANKVNDDKPLPKKSSHAKVHQDLAANDSAIVPVQENTLPEQLIAEHSDKQPVKTPSQETTIVINEGISNDTSMQKMVVLDDNDLAELGLMEKSSPNSKLADAVNSVGKLFNVNAHYNKSQDPQSKPTETWALGPLKIKRTVTR